MHTIGTWELWLGFILFMSFVFCIDFAVLGGKRAHTVPVKEALTWTIVWMLCAFVFDLGLWWYLSLTTTAAIAQQKALEFLTGFIIEQSLSVDNLFVFILIFNYFVVPKQYQRRVLLYGVLGAIIMRLLMIVSGTWLVTQFHWILYFFGAFLLFTGVKMLLMKDDENDLEKNALLKILRRFIRVTSDYDSENFFVKRNLVWFATPLFLVLILIEVSDLVFALDSIPAVFSVTRDPFIVFTSNIFAIMGLRALYFLLAYSANRFYLLKYGIAIVLAFVGIKMLIEPWYSFPIIGSLVIVISVLLTSIVLSLFARSKE